MTWRQRIEGWALVILLFGSAGAVIVAAATGRYAALALLIVLGVLAAWRAQRLMEEIRDETGTGD